MNESREMSKRILAEFLGFLKYKVEHDGMTLPDMQALLRVIEQIPVYATADEIAGFTFSNPYERVAIVAVGPTTDGEEFINTLTHEIHHLAVAIAASLGIDLESETPAYVAGDSALALAETICELGCRHCR